MACIDEKREGIAAEHATGHGGAAMGHAEGIATEHAAGHGDGTERPGGTATEGASGTCTDLGHLTDVDMTSGDDRKTHPILEVAFPDDMWWSLPSWLSQAIYNEYAIGKDVSYVWDWGDRRSGSYSPEGQTTTFNRYTIDFKNMMQTNSDNNRKRSVRWIWICEDDMAPAWSGQIEHRCWAYLGKALLQSTSLVSMATTHV